MSEKVLSAGDEIDSYCTTCKLVLAHQIVALVDGKAEKVLCKTCGKQHKYRPNPPKSRTSKARKKTATKKKKSTTKKKTTRTRRRKDPAKKWEETLAKHENAPVKEYGMDKEFDTHDLIEHDKFGRGLVTEVQAEGKMEVIFKEGTKLLVFGRK